MNKPLFDVKLKIWDNWKCYWNSIPWVVKKMSGYDSIGKDRVVAGAFDPGTRTVHLFMDEISRAAIARLGERFTSGTYRDQLVKDIFSTLTHELMHSLDMFDDEKDNETHMINAMKFWTLINKSPWYNGILSLRCNEDEYDNPTDSSTEHGNSQGG
jgi:hypothetical protein